MEIRFNENDPIWDMEKFRRVLGEMHYGMIDEMGKRDITISLPRKHFKAITDNLKLDAGIVFNAENFEKPIERSEIEKIQFDHFTSIETGTVHFIEI